MSTTNTAVAAGRLGTRDLINVGVFAALYFVVVFGTGMLGIIAPWVMFLGYALGILLNGIVIALYVSRTPKFGALGLIGLINGLLFWATGHPWFTPILAPLLGLAGDAILAARRRDGLSAKRFPLAYAVMSLWYIVPLLPIVLDPAGYWQYVNETMGADYSRRMQDLFQAWVLPAWAVGILILGLLGGMIGVRATRRHFERSGLA